MGQGKDERGHHIYLQILEELPCGRIRLVLFGSRRVIVGQVGGSCREIDLCVSIRKPFLTELPSESGALPVTVCFAAKLHCGAAGGHLTIEWVCWNKDC